MSIFPSETINVSDLIQATVTASGELPLAKEYAWDFDENDFLLTNGKNSIVTGREALKVWMLKVLKVPKNRFKAYTRKYGNDFEELLGYSLSKAALDSEIERYMKESMLYNPYILNLSNIVATIDGSKVSVNFTAETIYGEVIINV